MNDLATWLLEQIAEDERRAGEVTGEDDLLLGEHLDLWVIDDDYKNNTLAITKRRVLAECGAKKLILREHRRYDVWVREVSPTAAPPYAEPSCVGCGLSSDEEPRTQHIDDCPVLRALALPYADRPGYREEWRPQ